MNDFNPTHFLLIGRDPAGNIASRRIATAEFVERFTSHMAQDLLTVEVVPLDEQETRQHLGLAPQHSRAQKETLAWQLYSEIMRISQQDFFVSLLHPNSGADSECLTLVHNQSVAMLNLNGENALINGQVIEGIWGRIGDSHTNVAHDVLEAIDDFLPDSRVQKFKSNTAASTHWVAEILASREYTIEWCWHDEDGESFPKKELLRDFETPSSWKELKGVDPSYRHESWIWAVKHAGERVALINFALYELQDFTEGQFLAEHPGPAVPNAMTANVINKMNTSLPIISFDAALALKKYVYALRDPRNQEVFYVGKGTGDRIIQHKKFADEKAAGSPKVDRIKEIETAGFSVEHLLLRTGLETDDEALIVEQAVIDAFAAAKMPLTNLVKGHHAGEFGLKTIETFLIDNFAEIMGPLDEPLVMFKIQSKWKPDMNAQEIYASTRGHWVIGDKTREAAKFAFGIAHGIVRGVYRITSWSPCEIEGLEDRWTFSGETATELQHFVGTRATEAFKPFAANPVVRFLEGYPG